MWQALATELADDGRGGGLDIVAIAVDESVDDVRPWVTDVTIPVLIDRDRTFCDLYGVTNVPTVIWLDEAGIIVRPNEPAFGDDTFRDFHGIDSSVHHQALREWVLGTAGDTAPAGEHGDPPRRVGPTPDEQLGRTHFRLGVWLLRNGFAEDARAEFERAGTLAPDDFTIWRAALPLSGGDPFGQEFFDRFEAWKGRTGGVYYPEA